MKLTALAVLTVGMFAVSQGFAGEKACCAHGGATQAKMNCSATFANLSLNADQQKQMEKLAADCEKGGCNEQTMAKLAPCSESTQENDCRHIDKRCCL